MATLLYKKRLTANCLIGIDDLGNNERDSRTTAFPDPPAPIPEFLVGGSELVISTRCPDYGKVDLAIWAGDPGPAPPAWKVVFDGPLKCVGKGFDVGDVATFFHLDTAPGVYRVRAETRHDSKGYVDGVRFVFPETPSLTGETLY